jgi:hypothetical protein
MITYDIKEGQLVRLFHGRPDMAWDIEQLTQEKKMKNLDASTAQLVWEILNAALYDITKGDKSDGIAAIEEAIQLMEGKSK